MNRRRRNRVRRGVVLVAVLVMTALASMIAAGLMFRMHAELSATRAAGSGQQAIAAAMSGLQRAIHVLGQSAGDPDARRLRDNPDLFRNQLVCDDGAARWYFTIYARNPADESSVRYGLSDEAGKINVNTANARTLLNLPGMTEELVDCLIDYRDRDDKPLPSGAENEYYAGLPTPYSPRNAPLATLEELLMVKGFTAPIVFGEDANFNGILDPNEDDGQESFPIDDGDGQLNVGLRGLTTAISCEPDVDNEGNPRVNVNTASAMELREAGLGDETAGFIELCRKEGKTFKHRSELLEMTFSPKRSPGRGGADRRSGTTISSGVGVNELATVMDKLTCLPAAGGPGKDKVPVRYGLVNVNTAPVEVLSALPEIDETLATRIVDARGSLDAEARATIAWLYAQDVVSAETFRKIAPALTARSFQYRVQCVGFSVRSDGTPGGFRIIEAVLDLTGGAPRISYLRDITRLGLPFAIDVEQEQRQ